MPCIEYVPRKFSTASLGLIVRANEIIDDYQAQGYDLTLRQLYYQFVARGLLPNEDREYKRLGSVINDARLAGLVDWLAIEDRTRNLKSLEHWEGGEGIVSDASGWFQFDRWSDQPNRIEVWVEKEALAGVFSGVANALDVPHFACRGYVSQSEMWRAAQRMIGHENRSQRPVVLHFGDHDPSGIDMTRDITDRLALFGCGATVERLALNMDQVEEHRPPPNPAKLTDSRIHGYAARFGNKSWELDALEPALLVSIVEEQVAIYRDQGLWDEREAEENQIKETLERVSENWQDVADYIGEL